MASSYPWGAQLPHQRLKKLQSEQQKNEAKRLEYMEAHKTRLAQFQEVDRKLKSEIEQCEQIIRQEKAEQNNQLALKVLSKLLGSANPEVVEQALKGGLFEEKLHNVLNEIVKDPAATGAAEAASKNNEAAGA